MSEKTPYNKDNPFLASLKARWQLSKMGSNKKTHHIVLDIHGSGLTYEVGDSIGVYSKYAPDLVEKTLVSMRLKGDEKIVTRNGLESISFRDFLTSKANINDISQKFFKEVLARQTNQEKKERLQSLLEETAKDELKSYLALHEVWDFLMAHEEVFFSPQEYVEYLMPLLPRFYSISSAQKYTRDEIHLTISAVEYESNGHKRRGVCTHYLCDIVEEGDPVVPIFVQPSHAFRLPHDPHETSLIMVGPGTGVAPFRAFLQERILHHNSKGKHWLFFGEQHRAHDFYYEEDWIVLRQQGHLDLELAFSRDQEEKVYVHHRMRARGEELFKWLEDGAYFYVCGDADQMAKDVERTLLEIIQVYGKKDLVEAKEYLRALRQQKRYLRDVY